MTQVLLAVVVALAVLLVALAVVVRRLRAQVRRLADGVAEMRLLAPPGPRLSRQDQPSAPPARQDSPTPGDGVGPSDVTVITQLSEVPADLTTARIASVTFGRPLIKVAAFAHGVRRALEDEQRVRMAVAFRQELRRQRKLRRRATRATPVPGSGP